MRYLHLRSGTGETRRRRGPIPLAPVWMVLLVLAGAEAGLASTPSRRPIDAIASSGTTAVSSPGAGNVERSYPVDGTPVIDGLLPELVARFAGQRPPRSGNAAGAAETFFTVDLSQSPPTFITVSATLRAESATTKLYVEDAQWGNRVDQAVVDAILAAFDQRTPPGSIDSSAGIASIVETVYGPPTDVDGDGKVHILVLDIRDGFSGSGGYVAGYYTSHDQTSQYGSNQRDLLYIDSNPANPTGGEVLGTVAHEYQHLVHFRADPDEGQPSPFMNEALSELASYLCGYGLRSPASYFADTDVALDGWSNVEADYARVAVWAVYLYEQFGVSFVRDVFQQSANGISGVELTLGNAGRGLLDVMDDWFVAVAANNADADPRYGFRALVGTATPTTSLDQLPATVSGSVQPRAFEIVRFQGVADLRLALDQTGGSGLAGRILGRRATTLAVAELPIGTSSDASSLLGAADFDEYLLLPHTTAALSADYRVDADGTSSNIVEIAYDDGVPEEMGVLSPNPNDRGLAVRFTPEPLPATLRRARFYTADPTPFEVHVWTADASGPGIDLIEPIVVTPPSGMGWIEVDLSTAQVDIDSEDVCVGLIAPGGSSGEVSVGLDETPPTAGRSYLFDGGSWHAFDDIGLEFADLMIRLELQYYDPLPPQFTIGMLQSGAAGDQVEVYVATESAIGGGMLEGTFESGELSEPLVFTQVEGNLRLYVAQGPATYEDGEGRIVVTGTAALSPATRVETLDLALRWINAEGGTLALGTSELDVPAAALSANTLLTAQPSGVYPGGPFLANDPLRAQVTFGPQAAALLVPATVRLPGEQGAIARWTNGEWVALPTQAVAGGLETATATLGAFTVIAGSSTLARPIRLVVPLNPVGTEATIALELAAAAPEVVVDAYDVSGRLVRRLYRGGLGAGSHSIPVNLSGERRGIYFVRAAAGNDAGLAKLILLP